jgi:hypothetical protein
MTWKNDAFSLFFLGIDVNTANENGVATIQEYKEDEAADVRNPAR